MKMEENESWTTMKMEDSWEGGGGGRERKKKGDGKEARMRRRAKRGATRRGRCREGGDGPR